MARYSHFLQCVQEPDVESMWLLYRGTRTSRRVSQVATGIIYHAPTADSSHILQYIMFCLDYISRTHPCAGFVVLGDFNHLNDSSIVSYPFKQVVKYATIEKWLFDLDKIYTITACWH